MKASELIDKIAIRTAPSSSNDPLFTDYPVKIIISTGSHIIVQFIGEYARVFGEKRYILNYTFCDDNWVDAEEIFKMITDTNQQGSKQDEHKIFTLVSSDKKDEVSEDE